MTRREFVSLLSSAMLAWPGAAHAQSSSLPTIGFLNVSSPVAGFLDAFRTGLSAHGYVEGQNVLVDYRWAKGDHNRLRQYAAELVERKAAVIVATGGTISAHAAKDATWTIPIVFVVGNDPVAEKLVFSISRPAGNATGVSLISTELLKKRMELLHELMPSARKIALLVNARTPSAQFEKMDAKRVANEVGRELIVVEASTANELENALQVADDSGAEALLVTADAVYTSNRAQIVELAKKHHLPTCYPFSLYAAAGGLVSYGPNVADGYRQAGDYVGRILLGTKPEDLPVQLPTIFELVINLKTAKALDLEVPPTLLARANKVIE